MLSGFTMDNHEGWVWVGYGRRGRGYKQMNLVGIDVSDFAQNVESCLGLLFGLCSMVKQEKVWSEFTREEVELLINGFCLLLPLPRKEQEKEGANDGRTKQCAIFFDDWDIMNRLGCERKADFV